MAGFEPNTMCHLLGPHFPVFALTNWATLAVERFNLTCPIIPNLLRNIQRLNLGLLEDLYPFSEAEENLVEQ